MQNLTIGIIDYKAGNAPSVLNAFRHLDIPAELISTPEQVSKAEALVLPGVGSAAATMESLETLGLLPVLQEKVIEQKTPFLGICIGMQILFTHSEEGNVNCLNWLPGRVRRFPENLVRIPQMGWNEVRFRENRASAHFYFVNSYYVEPADDALVAATADYGISFCAVTRWQNITATQFHLEKSGAAGLKLLGDIYGGMIC